MAVELTIGMAVYDDFDGMYFTTQALRMYQDMGGVELLIVDNKGCDHTQRFAGSIKARYIRATETVGTAAPRDRIFKEAKGNAVLCVDCHVLLTPKTIKRLKRYYRWNPNTNDLLQGPLLYDNFNIATHFDPVWRSEMWGTWGLDKRGEGNEPFDIPMQGLGLFSCRREAWLGFNPKFKGFGGEEGYIHEKFRQAGRRCLCLPWLRWMHRFEEIRPHKAPYPLSLLDKIHNYVVGHHELGLPLQPIIEHFSKRLSRQQVLKIVTAAVGP